MALAFAIAFAPGHPREFADWCLAAEDSGFEWIGVVDSQSIYREVYVSCTAGLGATSTVKLGPRVTNPVTRHITATAAALITLSELGPGRVFVGIGTGDSALINIGLRPVKLSALVDFISSLRRLLNGEQVRYQSKELRLTWGKAQIPIFAAAHGPKALRVAGQYADGVIVGTGVGDDIVPDALAAVSDGASRSGRDLESLKIWWHLSVSIAENREQALAQIRFNLASKVNHMLRFPDQTRYLPEKTKEALNRIHKHYNYLEHLKPGVHTTNTRLIRESGIEDYLADRYAIIGTPEECRSRLKYLEEMGISNIWINVYTEDNIAFMRRWSKEVMAHCR